MEISFYFDLWIRIFEVIIIFIVKFLIKCLISEILKDKDTSYLSSTKIHDVTTGLNLFLNKQLANVFNHSIGMNSRATHLKFVCPRMSHYACY